MRSVWFLYLATLFIAGCCPVCCWCIVREGEEENPPDGIGSPIRTGAVAVKIISSSDVPADVVARFLAGGVQLDSGRIGVPARGQGEIIGPDAATTIVITGTYEGGAPVPTAAFEFGTDFTTGMAAVYYLPNPSTPGPPPPAITILEPAAEVRVPLGGLVHVRWSDEDDADSAMIRFFLVSPGGLFPGAGATPLGEALPEDPDGPGDQADLPVRDVAVGSYELHAIIDNGSASASARAPGTVVVTPAIEQDPCPDRPAAFAVHPTSGRLGTVARVTVNGANFALGIEVRLARAGQPTILGRQVYVATDGASLTCDFDLGTAVAGAWDVVVSTADCPAASLPGGFEVEPFADFDADGDVDRDDFRLLSACMNGPNNPLPAAVANCVWADLDADGDVDTADVLEFQACFNGPGRPPACGPDKASEAVAVR